MQEESERNVTQPPLMHPSMDRKSTALLNALQLAYMGDAVWETLIRTWLIERKMNVHHMHLECVRRVNASAQASALKVIRDTLSEAEHEIVQRGRNAHAKHPSPKNQDPADYAEATGFEALIGFLYLTGQQERLREIRDCVLNANDRAI